MDQNWNDLVREGKEIAGRTNKDQWHLGELASKVVKSYNQGKLRQYAEEIKQNYTTLAGYRVTAIKWPEKKFRPRNFSVAKDLNRHPDREKIVCNNPDITSDEVRALMAEWREANGKKKKLKTYEGSLKHSEVEAEIRQRVQDGIDDWMAKFRPHILDAQAIKAGRKGVITKEEDLLIRRCLHPDNSASENIRNKAFTIWQRIEHLLMNEQDAPTVIHMPRRRRA